MTTATNLLFLCSDEHQSAITGCYGDRLVRTPNIDKLAARGTVFANAYCAAPLCVPARASMATGRYAHEVHSWCNSTGYSGRYAESWGHRLTSQGHHVTTIGKLHYHSETASTGFPDQRIPMHLQDGKGDVRGLLRGRMPVYKGFSKHVGEAGPGSSAYTRYDEGITAHAVHWLQHEAKGHHKPWALFVSYLNPHYPLAVPQRFLDLYPEDRVPLPTLFRKSDWPDHPALALYRRLRDHEQPYEEQTLRRAIATYYGMVTFIDEQIGKVLYALEESGLLNSTRVIYTSDHGEHLGNHGLWWKRGFYNTAAAVPLLMAGPGIDAKSCGVVTSHVDLFPTIVETVGAQLSDADKSLPGRSLYSLKEGERRHAFSEYHGGGSAAGSYMIRTDRYKYVYYCDGPPQLFDMVADPLEKEDLGTCAAHESVRLEHHAILRSVCDPEAVDRQAKEDQQAYLEELGGEAAILAVPVASYFPPPDVPPPGTAGVAGNAVH